jgi:hypothetical protein
MHASASIVYQCAVVDGPLVVRSFPPRRNLILDAGLDNCAGWFWGDMTKEVYMGIGTLPTKRDSGTITFTRAGGVITASAGFFDSSDVGRILKWDTGEEVYITGFSGSSTSVTCASGPSIPAAPGTIWYVNRSGLVEQVGVFTTIAGAGDTNFNGSTIGPNQTTMKRTLISGVQGAPVTITELGWGRQYGAGARIFGIDTLAVPIALGVGQQLRVTISLTVTYPDVTQLVACPNVGTNGINTAGTLSCDWWAGNQMDYIGNDGITGGGGEWFSPRQTGVGVKAASGTFTQTPGGAGQPPWGPYVNPSSMTAPGYLTGSRTLSNKVVFLPGSLSTVHGLLVGADQYPVISLKFTTPQVVASDKRLEVFLTKTWGRNLIN